MKGYPKLLDFKSTCRYSFRCPPWLDGRRFLWHEAANHPYALCCRLRSRRLWNAGNGRPPSPRGWCAEGKLSSYWPLGTPTPMWDAPWGSSGRWSARGPNAFWRSAWTGSPTPLAAVPRVVFPPEVAIHVVRLACERPDSLGRSLSQWDCTELARQLIAEGVVEGISAATVRRILACHHLKPWRHHLWLYPKHPRDAAFYTSISELIDLYTRLLHDDEVVLSVDEKTSLQPRPRLAPTRPAQPGNIPNRYEHEYKRRGALNLFAAFDTRSGIVFGQCYPRKRQQEFITFLAQLDAEMVPHIKTIHLVCDHVSTHHGTEVRQWLVKHPRFVLHFTPVHCSWMNQVEQWFSILQRKRLRIADFDSKEHLQAKIEQFIREWNQHAHPFNWLTKSVAKVMAEVPAMAA